jgi:hypothetical protein
MGTLIQSEFEGSEDYELDVEKIEWKGKTVEIVELSRKNVFKVEAMIRTDSNYRNTSDDTKGIDSIRKGYGGSSSYWLKQLKEITDTGDKSNESNDGYGYEKIVENLVIAIDIENSTHLNSDKNGKKVGRKAVAKRISELDIKDLIEYLKSPRKASGKEFELIDIIQIPTEEYEEKRHLSFATKFCHFACSYLFKGTDEADNFSIYDTVLKKALPKYIKKYLPEVTKISKYEDDYGTYIGYIDKIIAKLKEEEISRNGFDHLLWYYHKGR